ncbi:MAG: hypothetical protein ACRDTE_10845 [Pseudonocardiaceae bacterium]
MSAEKIITGLSSLEAHGLACVACGAAYVRVPHVSVGRSVTGTQVFTCVGCYPEDDVLRAAEVRCGERHSNLGSGRDRSVQRQPHPRFSAEPPAHDDRGMRFTSDGVSPDDSPKCLFV